MDAVVALLGLAVVHLLAVASPGPSTVLVVQTAAVAGRRGGLIAAFAMMLGALAWAAAIRCLAVSIACRPLRTCLSAWLELPTMVWAAFPSAPTAWPAAGGALTAAL